MDEDNGVIKQVADEPVKTTTPKQTSLQSWASFLAIIGVLAGAIGTGLCDSRRDATIGFALVILGGSFLISAAVCGMGGAICGALRKAKLHV